MIKRIDEILREGWNEIKTESDFWIPENPGDELKGIYLDLEPNSGTYNQNKYTFKDFEGHERIVYGTKDLDAKLEEVELGTEVLLILDKLIPQKPPKSAFKVFRVFTREGGTISDESDVAPTQDLKDDAEARNMINLLQGELVGKHKVNPELIYKKALEFMDDWELSDEDMTRIKAELVRMFPSKKK